MRSDAKLGLPLARRQGQVSQDPTALSPCPGFADESLSLKNRAQELYFGGSGWRCRRCRGWTSCGIRGNGQVDLPTPSGRSFFAAKSATKAKTKITQGLFLVLIGRAQAPVWDVAPRHHLERKKPMPYINHYSFFISSIRMGPHHDQNHRASSLSSTSDPERP